MSVCVVSREGEVFCPRHLHAAPELLLKAIAPSREDVVVSVACLCPGDGLADLCAPEGLPFVLGHALDLKAIPGGTATHATIEAHTLAVLRRGGMRPQASV